MHLFVRGGFPNVVIVGAMAPNNTFPDSNHFLQSGWGQVELLASGDLIGFAEFCFKKICFGNSCHYKDFHGMTECKL